MHALCSTMVVPLLLASKAVFPPPARGYGTGTVYISDVSDMVPVPSFVFIVPDNKAAHKTRFDSPEQSLHAAGPVGSMLDPSVAAENA
jgi:hypothetical protein